MCSWIGCGDPNHGGMVMIAKMIHWTFSVGVEAIESLAIKDGLIVAIGSGWSPYMVANDSSEYQYRTNMF